MHFCTLGRFLLVFCVGDDLHDIVEGTAKGGTDLDEDIYVDHCAFAVHFRYGCSADSGQFCKILLLHITVNKELESLL